MESRLVQTFGAHSLKVNTLATEFNGPIHQESNELIGNLFEDGNLSELNKVLI